MPVPDQRTATAVTGPRDRTAVVATTVDPAARGNSTLVVHAAGATAPRLVRTGGTR